MKNKIIHTLFLCYMLMHLSAQTKLFELKKGNCQLFNGQLYTYGLSGTRENETLFIYKLNSQLIPTDSLVVELTKGHPENYLQLYSDTLHDFLNVYLQKEEKGQVSVFRFNKEFELVVRVDNIDVARINNTSLFDAEVLYVKNHVYSLKIINDSTGKQFYINKFELRSAKQNFDYELKWQFPFERKNVQDAHVFYANKHHLLVFVYVSSGLKTGQWILNINATNGQLIKATKLNSKGETGSYLYGDHLIDPIYNSIHLIGQNYTETQYDFLKNKLSIENSSSLSMYYLQIDSLGEILTKQIFKIPVTTVNSGAKKVTSSYLLKCSGFKKNVEGKLVFEGDIYKSEAKAKCFLYSNSSFFYLTVHEDKFILEKNNISSNVNIEDYYYSKDPFDLNGKLCMDSSSQYPKLMYQKPGLHVKSGFKLDENKNPLWLLTKHSFNKNSVNYSLLGPNKNTYQLSQIEDISENKFPGLIHLNSEKYLIYHQFEEGKLQLKIYTW